METIETVRTPYPLRLAAVVFFLLIASAVTTTAYTRDAPLAVSYVCAQGDRFTVEYREDHARLRHGTGIFVLGKESADEGSRYSDGNLTLWTNGETATLAPDGPTSRGLCVAKEQNV